MKRLAILLLFVLSGSACGYNSTSFDLASTPVIYTNQDVVRGKPEVYVYPTASIDAPPMVMMVPFRVTQPMKDVDSVGYGISRIFWQTWSSMGLFNYMEFSADAGPFRRDLALGMARRKGAELLIGGFITHLNPGGSISQTSIAVQVEAYDVQSGVLVWSMGHSGTLPRPETKDYMLFTTQTQLPADAVQSISQALARDLGGILAQWTKRDASASGEKKKDGENPPKIPPPNQSNTRF